MTLKDLLKNKEYEFLNRVPNLAYLSVAGSRAYGTNTPNSDTDVRGFFMDDLNDMLGMTGGKEQYEDKATDTVVYSFRKFVKLVADCNPNVVELLGTKPEHHLLTSKVFDNMVANKHLFLSKRAFYSFSGYAVSQLRRLENGLSFRDGKVEDVEKHLVESLNMEVMAKDDTFMATPDLGNYIEFSLGDEEDDREDALREVYVSCKYDSVTLRDFLNAVHDVENTVKNYGRLNKRNNKKDDAHLYKHAMHLLRLYYMGMDLLKYGEVNTYREKEHDLLMSVRNGEMSFDRVFAHQRSLEKDMQAAYERSKLPERVDKDAVNAFVVEQFREFYGLS